MGLQSRRVFRGWALLEIAQIGRFIVTEAENLISVNLYPSAEIRLPESGVRLEMESDFPRMRTARILVVATDPKVFTLALRVPLWAKEMRVTRNGESLATPEDGGPVLLTGSWRDTTAIEIVFHRGYRLVPWPAAKQREVAIFDGPLCLGLPSDAADVDLPWAVLVDSSGGPHLDDNGRPQVIDPAGRILTALEPIGARWLLPDVADPLRRRVLFGTQ